MVNSVAIIVAAGTGRRMNSSVKKQYIEINSHPVLYYTLRAFEESAVDGVVVVTGADETDYVKREIVDRYCLGKVLAVIAGGKERFDSVYCGIQYLQGTTNVESCNGAENFTAADGGTMTGTAADNGDMTGTAADGGDIADTAADGGDIAGTAADSGDMTGTAADGGMLSDNADNGLIPGTEKASGRSSVTDVRSPKLVLVHDGVRLLVTPELINRVISETAKKSACIAAVPVKDTIKTVDINDKIKDTCDRSMLRQVQTPQGFDYDLLRRAYESFYQAVEKESSLAGGITDDAMLVERFTEQPVYCVMGDYKNIKITTPEDIRIAEAFLGL